MSKSDYFENALLKLIFNGVAIQDLAEDQVLAPLTHIPVALHTADPGEDGNQSTNEIVYTGYERAEVIRTEAGWLVSGSNAYAVEPVEFPEMLGGPGGIATHASCGDGLGNILYSGPIDPTLAIVDGVIPRLKGLAWFASGQASNVSED